jgi:hypothetical protein
MTQTIAEQIKWDFETNGELEIWDKNGNRIYWENSNRDWLKWEHDSKGNTIYFESSSGFWEKMEYDSEGNQTYYENSYGRIIDERPKSCESDEIVIEGVKYKLIKV